MSATDENLIEKAMETSIAKPNTSPSVVHADENKTKETANTSTIDSTPDQSPVELNGKSTEERVSTSVAVPCEMEVTEHMPQTEMKSVEIESVKSIEMDVISAVDSNTLNEAATELVTESTNGQQKAVHEESENIAEKGPEKDSANEVQQQENSEEEKSTSTNKETVDKDTIMETQKSENKSKSEAPKANISIGSLGLLNQYDSSSDEDEDSSSSDDDGASADSESETDDTDDSSNAEILGTPAIKDKELNTMANNILNSVMSRQNYRDVSSDSSDTDTHDSDVECIGTIPAQTIDITNDEEIQEFLESCEENTQGPMKTKGELGMNDLPPIAELTITVPESECVELGNISGIVDTLVLVDSKPGFAAVDIDTVLFLEKGNRTLGQVFDVMGNVASPIYCVRFNTTQDITAKNITVGLKVYVAPQTEYTNFIVLSNLMRERGCDASWENDNEAPDGCFEFSDDEEERLNRRAQNQRQRNKNRPSESSDQLPDKVTVKPEPNVSMHKNRRPNKYNNRQKHTDKPPQRFYKDNRGYANPDASSFYHPHQRMQPVHHNYSWHTAAMHGMPSPTTSSQPMQPPYAPPPPPYGAAPMPNHGHANVYPNPFAMQPNYGGPFNLQAFPPLPPSIGPIPAHHQPPQLHPPSSSYNRNRKSGPFQHQHPKQQ